MRLHVFVSNEVLIVFRNSRSMTYIIGDGVVWSSKILYAAFMEYRSLLRNVAIQTDVTVL